MDNQTDGQSDRWTIRQVDKQFSSVEQTDRWTNGEFNKETIVNTDVWSNRQLKQQTGGGKDRQYMADYFELSQTYFGQIVGQSDSLSERNLEKH
jgi:hypothetical protein